MCRRSAAVALSIDGASGAARVQDEIRDAALRGRKRFFVRRFTSCVVLLGTQWPMSSIVPETLSASSKRLPELAGI